MAFHDFGEARNMVYALSHGLKDAAVEILTHSDDATVLMRVAARLLHSADRCREIYQHIEHIELSDYRPKPRETQHDTQE